MMQQSIENKNQISTESTPDDLATLLNLFHSFIHSLMNESSISNSSDQGNSNKGWFRSNDGWLFTDGQLASSEARWIPNLGTGPAATSTEIFILTTILVTLGIRRAMDISEKTWLACILETEGSVGYVNPKKTYGQYRYPLIQFVNTDIALIKHFCELTGSKFYEDKRKTLWAKKQLYRTYLYNKKAVELLRIIEPYFIGEKKTIVKKILEAYPVG